jgi:hypothetical protein
MFVQVIQGRVSDAAAMRTAMDGWMRDLAPGATGWLGSTAGVTDDGRFVALARFESEEAARRNSDRPEQGEWWAETAKLLDGEATFHDSTSVIEDLAGDPGDAGFVQVMQGRGSDPDRARELMTEDSGAWRDFRPDILGTLSLQHDGDGWTMAIWFTSEEAAREGERKEPPPEMKAQMDELNALMIGPPEFFDLKDPWLTGPNPS